MVTEGVVSTAVKDGSSPSRPFSTPSPLFSPPFRPSFAFPPFLPRFGSTGHPNPRPRRSITLIRPPGSAHSFLGTPLHIGRSNAHPSTLSGPIPLSDPPIGSNPTHPLLPLPLSRDDRDVRTPLGVGGGLAREPTAKMRLHLVTSASTAAKEI